MRYLGHCGHIFGDAFLFQNSCLRSPAPALLYVHDVLRYLGRRAIRSFRLPSQLLAFGDVISPDDWAALGDVARQHHIRLTMHLDIHCVLSSPDAAVNQRSINAIEHLAAIAQHLNTPDPVVVAHIGGAYDNRTAALQRCVAAIKQLSDTACALLAIEPDGRSWSIVDGLHIHAQTGIAVVYDHLHHQLYNPHHLDADVALNYALATWHANRKPKIHFSSPRTELRINGSGKHLSLEQPQWYEHSDFAHPFELIRVLRYPFERDYDIMLELKAGDLALQRIRADLERFAPDIIDVA